MSAGSASGAPRAWATSSLLLFSLLRQAQNQVLKIARWFAVDRDALS